MARVRLFENWSFQRPLPEPFEREASRRGRRTLTDEEALSVHNHMTRGKRSTLHGPTLRALILLADVKKNRTEGAFGIQEKSGNIKFYCMEAVKETSGAEERRTLVYAPDTGICRGMVSMEGMVSGMPQFGETGSEGKEIIALLSYASLIPGPLHDGEFETAFGRFCEELERQTDVDTLMKLGGLLCDNLYRRVANAENLGTAGIPFDSGNLDSGNLPVIAAIRLQQNFYSPSRTDFGEFEILKGAASRGGGTIASIGEKYRRGFELTEGEKRLVPALPDTYEVPEEAIELLEAVCNTPMRVFMSAGDAGTGKSTNAKIIAQLLGLPYYFFTCGEGTDEVDLVSSMVPNVGARVREPEFQLPTFRDMMMDPATALCEVNGVYEDEIDAECAFQKILASVYEKGIESGRKEKDFCLLESSIVTGCRRPSLIEIQEPSVIAKPGTLVKLNGLLDEGASITLASGEVVKRHPETVILLTTNMDYKGCRGFNESVLSRMRMVQFLEPLTAQEMADRVSKKVDFPDRVLLKQMAETACEIRRYCQTEMISGGVCGYREFEDWVWAYLVKKDVCQAAVHTIIAKAAPEKEDREELFQTQILTKFAGAMAA